MTDRILRLQDYFLEVGSDHALAELRAGNVLARAESLVVSWVEDPPMHSSVDDEIAEIKHMRRLAEHGLAPACVREETRHHQDLEPGFWIEASRGPKEGGRVHPLGEWAGYTEWPRLGTLPRPGRKSYLALNIAVRACPTPRAVVAGEDAANQNEVRGVGSSRGRKREAALKAFDEVFRGTDPGRELVSDRELHERLTARHKETGRSNDLLWDLDTTKRVSGRRAR